MGNDTVLNTLIRTDPFEMLSPDRLAELSEKATVRRYDAGTYVFKRGDPSLDVLFVIMSGMAEMVAVNERGDETVVGLKRPYDFFGETVVFSRQRYPAALRVKESLTCCSIERRDLEKLIYGDPEFSGFFVALITERMRLLYEEMATAVAAGKGVPDMGSSLFRKRVSEIMTCPPIICRTRDPVVHAARTMSEKGVNAIVALDTSGRPRGILTEKNMVRHLVANRMYPVTACRVEHVMDGNLMAIKPQAFIGQALVAMMRSKNKHLLVEDRGELVGVVSMADLIKTQSAGALLLTRDIESQPDLPGLARVAAETRKVLGAMVAERAELHEILDVMSELHERLARRVVQLSEERMRLEGFGPPPFEYCWIHLGSAARYEQTFGTDQDHALLYADPQPDQAPAADAYFARLAEIVVEGLESCGFDRCQDGIMAMEKPWRRSMSGWMALVRRWLSDPESGDTPRILALLDYRPVWGNVFIAEMFRKQLLDACRGCLARVSPVRAGYEPPINFLGTFITEERGPHQGEMNLKKRAIAPLVEGIRLLAGHHGVAEPSTAERIRRLTDAGVFDSEDGERFGRSLENLLLFDIRENMRKVRRGDRADHCIDPYSLRKRERVVLKEALGAVERLHDLIGRFGARSDALGTAESD